MATSPLAGKPAPAALLVDVSALVASYYDRKPDPRTPAERVSFGTSGHRGSSFKGSFNEAHILAITQAICDYRRSQGTLGPLFLGRDTHALSEPAQRSALEVLAANAVDVRIAAGDGFCPTPVVSHAILGHNRGRTRGLADGIVVTPSHNPPEDGGFKYNPPHGGPADGAATRVIEEAANALMLADNRGVARSADRSRIVEHDYVGPYVDDLGAALDLEAVRASGITLGVDPLGGASVHYWARIAERWGLELTVVNDTVDPRFAFMRVDHDGKIRMDCSSPYAMAGLVALKDRYDVAFGQDTDADRHGIVTRSAGLLNPNHYLCVAIAHLLAHRPAWPSTTRIGKTVVSSSLIDRVVARAGRALVEVPVGFKWFVSGLGDGSLGFGGEESAGASFLRRDGSTWTTDKDGLLLSLLAAEIRAIRGRDPGELYRSITSELGEPIYKRVDRPANAEQKARLGKLSPDRLSAPTLAGAPILAKRTTAPGNDAPIGGLKVITKDGWFAARPSGTEDVYKLYAESFLGEQHLDRILAEAEEIVAPVLAGG